MADNFKREWFNCLRAFSYLKGREKPWVIVGDNPDARIARFCFRSRVINNWPSQWHTRYKGGFIRFENGKRFNLQEQTIGGKPAFIFEDSHEIYIQYYKQTFEKKINLTLEDMAPQDRLGAMRGIRDSVVAAVRNRRFSLNEVLPLLSALSLSDLENLAERITAIADGRPGAPFTAAA